VTSTVTVPETTTVTAEGNSGTSSATSTRAPDGCLPSSQPCSNEAPPTGPVTPLLASVAAAVAVGVGAVAMAARRFLYLRRTQ
jgi:hypothetical protein